MSNGQAGKGDRYREVDRKVWDTNYEAVFGQKQRAEKAVKLLDELIDLLPDLSATDYEYISKRKKRLQERIGE